jgi:hypothetical protein
MQNIDDRIMDCRSRCGKSIERTRRRKSFDFTPE